MKLGVLMLAAFAAACGAASPAPKVSQRVRCAELADRADTMGAVSKGGAMLAGATGLSTIATDDRGARLALAIGAVLAGAIAAAADFVHDGATERRFEECKPPPR